MPLKNSCSIHARFSKSSLKHSIRFCGIFSKFKTEFIVLPRVQIGFLKFTSCDNQALVGVYSNCCCRCWFVAEIIKIGQSSHKMYSNKILNFQEFTTMLNACTKKMWKLIEFTTYMYIYISRYCQWPWVSCNQQSSDSVKVFKKTINMVNLFFLNGGYFLCVAEFVC